jgi:hypothetical protein
MANFIVIPLSKDNKRLNSLIPDRFGNDSYCLENGDWLLSYSGTSKQLSDELGITEDNHGTAVVLNFAGYWGRANPDIWEWLNEHSK